MSTTTLEAGTDAAAEEAADALAEEEARRDAENAETARRAEAAAATGMTQEEREQTASFDPAPEKKSRRRAPAAQGNLAGGWEDLIGGNEASESKIKLAAASIMPTNAPEHIRKGATFRLLVEVKATGYSVDDTLDPETHEVASTKEARKLRVTGARFLDPHEYIADDAGAGGETE